MMDLKKSLKMDLGLKLNFSFLKKFRLRRIPTKQLVIFTRQMATLIVAGLPLVKGLRTIYDQLEPGRMKDVVGQVADGVEEGANFSTALGRFPGVFPELFVNMIKAGEKGGMLEEILKKLSVFLEKEERLRSRLKSAMLYPIFVLGVATVIMVILMVFVVPTFSGMFDDLGGALPLPTKLLIATSNSIRYRWPVIAGIIAGIVTLYKIIVHSPKRKFMVDGIKLRMPVFGRLARETAVARFARTLGTLLKSGVPILDALETVRDTCGNEVVGKAIMAIHDSVKEGESVSRPMEESRVFPPIVVKMVNIGEETGQLDNLLVQVADDYEEEVDTTITGLTALLEPMLIVFMGVIVGFIVISMFLPLFSLAKLIG